MTKAQLRAIEKAVKVAGSPAKLAAAVGVSRQAVDQWLRELHLPSPRVARRIEDVTGVDSAVLRPHEFGPAP